MMIADRPTIESLSNQLNIYSQVQFTGRLDVQAGSMQQWSIYFCMGRLVWAKGGLHCLRRWQRLLFQNCPQIHSQGASWGETDVAEGTEYNLLIQWVKQRQIMGEQAGSVIRTTVAEVLFDILQQEKSGQLTFVDDRQDILDASLTLISPEQALANAKLAWDAWNHAGLTNVSPNLAPVLRQLEQLQQQTSAQVYETLVKVIDSEKTLRDVALLLKQDLLLLSQGLMLYIRKGWMELVKIPDLLPPAPSKTESVDVKQEVSLPPSHSGSGVAPLIACVDDSRLEQQIMERILTKFGYRFLGIEDSVQALPILLQHKPDLIFLDLVMPVANGYEICGQIRRISQFKNTPVVILTGNDGIVDRVRAKVAGSTNFLGKPIEAERVLAVLRKYLSTPASPPLGDLSEGASTSSNG